MAPQILQWITAECVEFLRKCAKQYAGIISDADLDIYVENFEQNHVAGSTLNFSDAQWNALIPSLEFGNCVRQQLQAKERICEQEMRTAVWNSSGKKAPEQQGKPTLKDMPSRLTIPASGSIGRAQIGPDPDWSKPGSGRAGRILLSTPPQAPPRHGAPPHRTTHERRRSRPHHPCHTTPLHRRRGCSRGQGAAKKACTI
jgi:hypothetical protein